MNEKNMTFEQSMQRLEQIVRTLERGDAQLDESLKLFQEGTELCVPAVNCWMKRNWRSKKSRLLRMAAL